MGAMLVRHEPTSVADVRRELAADLADNGVGPDGVDDVTLVASELVGNAVRHADLSPGGDLGIAWTITATTVLVSVSDAGGAEPELRFAAAHEPSGRGLAIVDSLSSTWGVERLSTGKRVWARVPIK
jgi:anti-sigma regulatory factor (Ser/Thr protein kinase)